MISKQNVGNVGEYYIASRLSAADYTTTITLGRAERYDILTVSRTGKVVKFSVKTTQLEKANDFPMSPKDETGDAADFYYAFVRIKETSDPDWWIIPSAVVCPIIKTAEERYIATPGKKGQSHITSSMRVFPVVVRPTVAHLYPVDWTETVKKYYKNFRSLKS